MINSTNRGPNSLWEWMSWSESNLKARIYRAFPHRARFVGAWKSFEEAEKAVPRHKLTGYNHDEMKHVAFDRMSSVLPWDYPVLFWLSQILTADSVVLDAGGHMGTKYRAFSPYLELSPPLRWVVYDQPKIIEEGQRLAERDGLKALEFIRDLADAPKANIVLASGLMQYLDQSLSELLKCMPERSRYVVLNKVAVRDGERIVTLENFDRALVPYQIRNRTKFFADIDEAGYEIMDQWTVPSFAHVIPTHPHLGSSESLGFCLRAI